MESLIKRIALKNNACEEAIKWLDSNKEHSDEWLWGHCTRPDWMVWFLRHSSIDLPKTTWVRIAVACAEAVLGVFEKKYPLDSRPRQAIEAAKAWLANPTSAAAHAATAANAAHAALSAYASYAADAASYAAHAASYAADATYAVDAVTAEKIRELVPWSFLDEKYRKEKENKNGNRKIGKLRLMKKYIE